MTSYAEDPKRKYVEDVQKMSRTNGSYPLENVLVYGEPRDACAKVEADQGPGHFTGTVCCDEATGRCRLHWDL
jgi:hypothetical protein